MKVVSEKDEIEKDESRFPKWNVVRRNSILNNRCLVIDLGSDTTKYGWSSELEPSGIVPTVVGRGRHKGAMTKLGLQNEYVGRAAQLLSGILKISHPISRGQIQNWDDLCTLWQHIVAEVNLSCSQKGLKVMLTVPPSCTGNDWKKLSDMLLNAQNVEVGSIFLANKSVLAMYGCGKTTGICIDSGFDTTYVVPIFEGSPLNDATKVLPIGGSQITDQLLALLSCGKYSCFNDDTFLLRSSKRRNQRRTSTVSTRSKQVGNKIHESSSVFKVATKLDVVREAKERFCYLKQPADKEVTSLVVNGKFIAEHGKDEKVLRLPDGNVIIVGKEAHLAPEILFKPYLRIEKKSSSRNRTFEVKGCGLADLVVDAVMDCDENIRNQMLSNIIVTGGNSLIPGFATRLQYEVKRLFFKRGIALNCELSVQGPSNHQCQDWRRWSENAAWEGGVHLASLAGFERLWLTKQEYNLEQISNENLPSIQPETFDEKLLFGSPARCLMTNVGDVKTVASGC